MKSNNRIKSQTSNEMRTFGELLLDVSRSGSTSKDRALIRQLNSISQNFILRGGHDSKKFDVVLGCLVVRKGEKCNITIGGIEDNYYRTLRIVFGAYKKDLDSHIPFLVEKPALEYLLNSAKSECTTRSSKYCFMLPVANVRKSRNEISSISHKLQITHYPSTFWGKIRDIDDDGVYLSLERYSNTHGGILGKRRAVQDSVYTFPTLRNSNVILKRLDQKLKDNSY